MADLDEKSSAQTAKIVGSDPLGAETNYAKVSTNHDLGVADIINSGNSISGVLSISSIAAEAKVAATTLADRKILIVFNNGSGIIYWGFNSNVTVGTGIPILKDQEANWAIGNNQKIYLVCTGVSTIRIAEGS